MEGNSELQALVARFDGELLIEELDPPVRNPRCLRKE